MSTVNKARSITLLLAILGFWLSTVYTFTASGGWRAIENGNLSAQGQLSRNKIMWCFDIVAIVFGGIRCIVGIFVANKWFNLVTALQLEFNKLRTFF